MTNRLKLALALLIAAAAMVAAPAAIVHAAVAAESDDAPYLRYEGGGFIFNYRVAVAYYGIVLRPARAMPQGTVVEARFTDPSGGPDIIVSKTYAGGARAMRFETPPLHGVKADTEYPVTVAVRAPGGETLGTYRYGVRSDLDQSVLPDKPLVVGPGYQLNRLGEPGPGAR